jgi:molybdate transport system regulatory protein
MQLRMASQEPHTFSYKVWIEKDGHPVLGKGGANILERVEAERSISEAARQLGMSYRYVWNYLNKIERAVGEPVIFTFRGGKSGGGGAELTSKGKSLLVEYRKAERYMEDVLEVNGRMEVNKLKISARNRLKGKITGVEKEGLMAKVRVELTIPATVTAMISKEAAEDLALKAGDQVEAIVKATEVMIAK